MKPELDRVKSDLETIQKAIGLAPSFGREWVDWLRRDTWLCLLWCVPGLILIASAFVPLDPTERYWGFVAAQWVGILVAAVMIGIIVFVGRKMSGSDGRPAGLVREYKRINAQGWILALPFFLYVAWGQQYGIGGEPFMAGLWLLGGSSAFLAAVSTRAWVLLGWAIPLTAFGLCQPLLHGRRDGLGLGIMFIAIALLSSIIQTWHLRALQKQHDTD